MTIENIYESEAAAKIADLENRLRHLERLETPPAGTVNGNGMLLSIKSVSTAYTITLSDFNIVGDASGGSFTITLPTAAASYDSTLGRGYIFNVIKSNSSGGNVTVSGNGAETINGSNTQVIYFQYDSITVQSTGTEYLII